MKIFLKMLVFVFLTCGARAETGIKVIDGDNLEINGKSIRLIGIDAPEYQQLCRDAQGHDYQCGQESLFYMQKLVDSALKRGDEVICHKEGVDRYKRDLSVCFVGELNINEEMVRAGWATVYRHDDYLSAEKEAKSAKRGMWQGKFMRPELYRVLKRYGKM